jgi:Rps23 Pro-64 3,4-dihydroxylase Tpa1-like proline 4-hydroxylase
LDRMLKTGHLVDGEWRFHLGGEWRQYTSSLGCYM